jgi:hypothetical protein
MDHSLLPKPIVAKLRRRNKSLPYLFPTKRPEFPLCQAEEKLSPEVVPEPPPLIVHRKGRPRSIYTDLRFCDLDANTVQDWLKKGSEHMETIIALRDNTSVLASAALFRITSDKVFSGLRVTNVLAPAAQMAGIILESQKGTLKDYMISGNLALVKDGIQGQGAIIANNMP